MIRVFDRWGSRWASRAAVCGVALAAAQVHGQTVPAAPPAPAVAPSCTPRGFSFAPPTYRSVEQHPDGRVTFKLCAPDAKAVRLTSSDAAGIIPFGGDGPAGLAMTKDDTGLWSVTPDAPFAADTYRFNFTVDGARVPDPQATTFSRERVGINSTFEVTGSAGAFQTYDKDVPHGAVSEIEYWSTTIGAKRRAQIYTPPGYMNGTAKYPVLYLVHGAGDSDDSWTHVGQAHHILDTLIAAGKARPMIIVMPFGHTPDRPGVPMMANDDFGNDLLQDLMPYVEKTFRTLNGPDTRAMAGLSMGGSHTIRYGLTHPELFHYIGIFSMGFGRQSGLGNSPGYEAAHDAALKRDAKELKLLYYALGKEDFLYAVSAPTRAMFDKYGIRYVYNESGGGHTWINWRRYLDDFAPRLFK